MSQTPDRTPLERIIISVEGVYYPVAIGSEVRRLLEYTFGWKIISRREAGTLLVNKWEPEDNLEPDEPTLPPQPQVPRSLIRELAEALGHFVSPELTVKAFVERNEKASCHVGLTTVYGCASCSRKIAAIRALQLAKAHGLHE